MNPYVETAWETLKAHPGEWFTMDAMLEGMIPPVTDRHEYRERVNIHTSVSHYLERYTKIGWIETKRRGRRMMWRWIE